MNVTTNSTSMNGTLSSLAASSQANWLSPAVAGLGGVCGKNRLNAASASDANPATVNVKVVACTSAGPVFDVPSAAPSHSMNGTLPKAGTFAQSTSRSTNGQLAAIHPIVPHKRTRPKSFCGSWTLAKAIELVIEIVGT